MPEKRLLEVQVNLEEYSESSSKIEIFAYVFSKSGRLLDKQPLVIDDSKLGIGKAEFVLDEKRENVVIKLGPNVEKPSDLANHSPQQKKVFLKPAVNKLIEFKIEKPFWLPWLFKPYYISGSVTKLVDDEELPIPFGEVDIYDVDINFIIRLHDSVIEKIRDTLIDVVFDPPPIVLRPIQHPVSKPSWWKDDYCGTPPGPRPPISGSIDVIKILEDVPQEWAFSRERYARLPQVRQQLAAKLESMTPENRSALLDREVLEGIKSSSLLYSNTAQFRRLLIDKFQSFRFWICWYPWIYWLWWPHAWYSLEKLGTAVINPDGTFSRIVWLRRNRKDIPDLWFRVRQQVNGVERIIYARYPVPCHTLWNHPSGDSVHLVVTDPQAVAFHQEHDISDDDDLWVCPVAIGNYSLKKIYGTGAEVSGSADPKIGLYSSLNSGLGGNLAVFQDGPFGGLLGLRILFSNGLLDAGIKYYRVKYRVNGSGDWLATSHLVTRHYSHYNETTEVLEFLPYHLGPQSIGAQSNCFEIRPKNPPNNDAEPDADWYVLDATVDLINAYIDTRSLTSGYLEIKVELFDQSGQQVKRASLGGTDIPFKLPSNTDILNTITTVDAVTVNPDLVRSDPENPNCDVFVFKLRFDNRKPTAFIDPPVAFASGNTITDCGIVQYEVLDTGVNLLYQARHPGTFGMYSFQVIRNNSSLKYITGRTGDMSVSGSFTIPAKLHQDPAHLSDLFLLKECHDAAAFSLNLNIWNMAFNGWSRVGENTSDVRAFALVPNI
ncbi:MAG: hypothetical protein CVU90_09475 [Firmicutes bacterium HGW-Firmicutes-15]|nr:MAG: hypothetical protein CVU90_09475 [Firmicutes bacterium HGW-Firmicutes-15]